MTATNHAATNHAATDQTVSGTDAATTPWDRLKASLRELLTAVVRRAADAVLAKVEQLAGKLERVAAEGSVGISAALGGVRAFLAGRNPVWGAIKGAVAALPLYVKILLVVAAILLLVLAPVLLVVLLVVALVAAIVLAIRAAGQND